MILDNHDETHDKYIQALKIMDRENVTSEYYKIPDTPEEKQFMKETNKSVSKRGFMFFYPQNMYEKIFRRNI